MIAPKKEISRPPIEKLAALIVGIPSSGESKNPANAAPTIPTTMLKKMPCWASVLITLLASQPRIPPIMMIRIQPMSLLPVD